MSPIKPITMPKWGLAMEEGVLSRWAVEEGAEIAPGQEIMDIETTKIANVFESPVGGVLRKKVVTEGETVPVGALLGVVAEPDVSQSDVDVFVEAFLASFEPAEGADESASAPEMVETESGRIRRLKAGPEEGTPLLLIHGFGADLTGWMFNQAELAAERPVHAIDLPGHGGSEKAIDDASLGALAKAVADYMDASGLATAHLVGHSLGGAIAVEIAAATPERVSALTLIAPAGFGTEISEDFVEGFIGQSRARKLRPVLEMLVADPSLVTADMVEEVLKFKRLDGAAAALRAIADASFEAGSQRISVRERLDELGVPVQVIWGEADQVLPAAHAEGLPTTIKVTRVADAGHILHMEKAADVNAAISSLE
jgi:pyruvate dehydrogenase E2 component (dihydrolipoamide acetyltransferase)